MKAQEILSKQVTKEVEMIHATESTEKGVLANHMVSFANILVATDFSPVSDHALEYALSLARRYEGRIFLTHVIPPGADLTHAPEFAGTTSEKERRTAEQEMVGILESGRLRGVPHEVLIEEGTLWPAIEGLVKKHEIDLIVVGTHGVGAFKKMLLGSGAEQIFRQARIPVLTVGPKVKGETPREVEFKNILFATDFGAGAEREAAYAFSLAQEHGAKLTLLNVVPYMEDYSKGAVDAKRESVTRQLKELAPAGSDAWCKTEYLMTLGEPVEQILEVASHTKADLIVMGAKTRKSLAGHVPNTKDSGVICAAPCPVLTVKS
jgi:nucleotide-binding universal stress UspA family protein